MKIMATILATNTPTTGLYTARTNFGSVVSGASLKGEPLFVGQQVSVFEVDGEFGAFDIYGRNPSVLAIPSSHRASIYSQNPGNTALAYIAKKANQERSFYATGTITGISVNKVSVSGKINGELPAENFNISRFTVGDTVLIKTYPNNAVLGWWNKSQDAAALDSVVDFLFYEPAIDSVNFYIDSFFEQAKPDGSGIISYTRLFNQDVYTIDLHGLSVADITVTIGGFSLDGSKIYLRIDLPGYPRPLSITRSLSGSIPEFKNMDEAEYSAAVKNEILTDAAEPFSIAGDYCVVGKYVGPNQGRDYVRSFYNKPIADDLADSGLYISNAFPTRLIEYKELFY